VTLTASTGARVVVSRHKDVFVARLDDASAEPQVCLGVDLFEVIAELAGLELEDRAQADEAIELAADVQRRLPSERRRDGASRPSARSG
jgi:hypothetical protein